MMSVRLLLFGNIHLQWFSGLHPAPHPSTWTYSPSQNWLPPVRLMWSSAASSSVDKTYVVVTAMLILSFWSLAGDWVHHSGPSSSATSHVPQRSVWLDAGMLATGTSHEAQHQRNPFPPSELGQGISSLPGYFRLKSHSISSYGLCEWMCSTAAELH